MYRDISQWRLPSFLTRMIVVSMLPAVLLFAWLAVDSFAHRKVEMEADVIDRASNFANTIDRLLEVRFLGLELLASSPYATDPQALPELYARAQDFRQTYGNHVIVADTDFQILFYTDTPLGTSLPRLPVSAGRTAAPIALQTKKPAIGDIVIDPLTGASLVALVVPVMQDGIVQRLLLVTLETRLFQGLIEDVALPTGRALTLLDSAGQVIARQPQDARGPDSQSSMDLSFDRTLDLVPWRVSLSGPLVADGRLMRFAILLLTGIVIAVAAGMVGGNRAARRIVDDIATLYEDGDGATDSPRIAEISVARQRLDTSLAALRESEVSHREIFESNPHPMWIYDLESLAFLAVNDAAIEHYGYSQDEFLKMTIADIRPPGETPRLLENVAAVTEGLDEAGVWLHRTRDGHIIEVEISSHTISFLGHRAELVHAHDVTEQRQTARELEAYRGGLEQLVAKRTEEARAAEQRAEQASRAKTIFLANMSHEIRTPLNAILGLTHLMRATADAAQRSWLEKVDAAGRHLLSIINDILDLSKIEAGQLELEQEDFHLSAVLDHIRSIIDQQATEKGLQLEVDPDGVPMWLRGDCTRLRQALLNYASNAIKFTSAGKISLRAILLEERGDRLQVRFEVEDTGCGVSPESQERIFAPFLQSQPSINRMHGGTGLGLTITRHIAESMSGEAGVESISGEGSTFWFTAWLERGHGVAQQREPSSAARINSVFAAAKGWRILLVEDNAVNREIAAHLLVEIGLNVDMAEDGLIALQMAKQQEYDVVLMDMQMPGLDGLGATREMRLLPGWSDIPIIAMTANAFQEDRRACLAAGMNDFIPKPVEPRYLYSVLAKWLEGRPPPVPGAKPANSPTVDLVGNVLPEEIEALDVTLGMILCGQDQALYLKMLSIFVESHRTDAAQIRVLAEDGQYEALGHLTHRLKGGAATLGATKLAAEAEALQRMAEEHAPDMPDKARALAVMLETLCAQLERAWST